MAFKEDRYDNMVYMPAGHSGLKLPAISLGMWHNFGEEADHENCRAMMRTAFDLGITHFDVADGYGPPVGAAEERVGRILKQDFATHRDELIISTKAGYPSWPGPYGDWGSRKHIIAGLDQSLKRLDLDYVDVFYHHRADYNTPVEETLEAMDQLVRQGKVLYLGISSYSPARFVEAQETVAACGFAPITLYQPCYNLFNRHIEREILPYAEQYGSGVICFSPLAQGLLTDKYLDPERRIPKESRAADPSGFLKEDQVTDAIIKKVQKLNKLAQDRSQTMAQMALAWVLRDARITSALIGARNPGQIEDCVSALQNLEFSGEELAQLDEICPS